jgi:hypothetical protein
VEVGRQKIASEKEIEMPFKKGDGFKKNDPKASIAGIRSWNCGPLKSEKGG